MGRYLAVVFADLERHSAAWNRMPRDRMAGIIAEYRYTAEKLAAQYGCLYREWAGDGHMFLFENADVAVQCSLKLIEEWQKTSPVHLPLRLGCHFGECTPLPGGQGWVGRGNSVAKRVESEAASDTLYVTENVLDLMDLPLYEVRAVGAFQLKGDSLASRTLHQIVSFDRTAFEAKPSAELNAQGWYLRGLAFTGTPRENSDEEAECYRQALRLRPEFAEAHNNLAILLRARGDVTEAVRHYQEALRLRPEYPEAHCNYAALLAAKGNLAGAAAHYREALRIQPNHVDAHHGYANLLKEQGDLRSARHHYLEALKLRPEFTEVHSNFAILLEALGEPDDAEAHYLEALRLQPDYPEAHYNVALLLESRGRETEAEQHYREALRHWPEYAEARNNLAALLYLGGNLAEAEEHYQEALRLRPDNPEVHYNYALLLRAKGDADGAAEHFRTASELAPGTETFKTSIEPPV